MSVFEMAEELLAMRDELAFLRRENASLQAHNDELLRLMVEGSRASEQQLTGWIGGILDGSLKLTEGAK
jgi:hypothetical protein